MTDKKEWGGKRKGAGRKPKEYLENTKRVYYRIPESHIPRISKLVETELTKLKITK